MRQFVKESAATVRATDPVSEADSRTPLNSASCLNGKATITSLSAGKSMEIAPTIWEYTSCALTVELNATMEARVAVKSLEDVRICFMAREFLGLLAEGTSNTIESSL